MTKTLKCNIIFIMITEFDPSEYIERLDADFVRADPLPVESYKVKKPWQVIWESRDPEERYFGFVELHEGHGVTPSTGEHASQFDFYTVVKTGVMKALELGETQNIHRDSIYIINAERTEVARIVLPDGAAAGL